MSMSYDAIVIGSGLAGATAARELGSRGKRVAILEARSRVGGRAWTEQFGGRSIEMGGQNVYWTEPFIWSEITRYGLPISEVVPFSTYAVIEDGEMRRYPASEAGVQLGAGFDAFFGDLASTMPRPYDPAFRRELLERVDGLTIRDRLEAIDVGPDVMRWLLPWMGMRTGGAPELGAFAWLLHIWALADWRWQKILEMSARYRLSEGMLGLLQAMLAHSRAELRLDTPVQAVEDDGERVIVTSETGETFAAPVAVVATSANLWQHIDFPGGLSDVKLEASREGMQTPNCFTKLWALVRGDVENMYVQRTDYESHPIIHLRKDLTREDGLTQVIAFSVDPGLDPGDEARVTEAFEQTLALDGAEIVDVKGHNWVSDPFTLGGTSLLRPGQLSRLDDIRRTEGRISFATADVASAAPGFDGAIQTGILAAADALRTLEAGIPRADAPQDAQYV